ncbi:MAG: dihydropteroate synthase [Desulfobacteraceae bacterium]|nr:dihydropteroate synthase [Desulfobacteraceae bacterium]
MENMILFGESLNVISRVIGKEFKEADPAKRNPEPIQEEALRQKELGMDYIDINLGPAKKFGTELMPWVVNVVQEAVPGMPLLLDSSNIDAIEAGLKVCKPADAPHIINSIMARPERYEKMVPLAAQYEADFVALMWGPEGLPRDENERAAFTADFEPDLHGHAVEKRHESSHFRSAGQTIDRHCQRSAPGYRGPDLGYDGRQ